MFTNRESTAEQQKAPSVKMILLPMAVFTCMLCGCRSSILEDPSITIQYSVPQAAHVTLNIENSYNTVIATPVDAVQDAGFYRASFDATGVQEGAYFYTLEYRGVNSNYYFKSTRTFLLLK